MHTSTSWTTVLLLLLTGFTALIGPLTDPSEEDRLARLFGVGARPRVAA